MKVPKLFKTEISEKRFQNRILRRIYVESELKFLLRLYNKGVDGRYYRLEELNTEDTKRLQQIARSIKKNRGVMRIGKVSLLAIVIAAILVFNFVFKNRLLEQALERGLESVFSARAEVNDLDFRILSGRISFTHLSVADRQQPFRNLFELGATELDLNTAELLKAKVIVSNLESREIGWNTPRQISGALAEDEQAEKEASGDRGQRKGLSLSLGNLDAKALVDAQMQKLSSPAQITALNSRLRTLQQQWQLTVDKGRADVTELSGRIDSVRSIDVLSLDTVPELQQAVADIREAATALGQVKNDVQAVNSQINTDREEIEAARSAFKEAVDADITYLASLSDFSSGELRNLVSDLVAGYLEQTLGRYYGYSQRIKGYADKLITGAREKRSDRKTAGRMEGGENIPFASAVYPRFLLENAGASVTGMGSSETIEGSIQNVSSDPDLLGRPVTFAFSRTQGEKKLSVDGVFDRRSNREDDLILGLRVANYSVELSEGLESLGLRSVSALYRFQTDFTLSRPTDSADGSGLLELRDLVLQPTSEQELLGRVLYETLGTVSALVVEFDYTLSGGGLSTVVARSSIDEQLSRALKDRVAEIATQYESRLREELSARIEAQLEDNETLHRAFSALEQTADGNLADVNAHAVVLEQKRSEVEERIADIEKQATDAVKSELEKQLDQIKDKVPLPRLSF
jgi:uncharacterized protein (TIGR03545 family)